MDIFNELARMSGCILWMVGGKWGYILCEWMLLMGGWGRVGVTFWWIRVGGHFLWVNRGGWGYMEVYFGWVRLGGYLLWVGGMGGGGWRYILGECGLVGKGGGE